MKHVFSLALIVVMTTLMSGCQTMGGNRPTQHVAPDPKAAELNMRLGLNYMQRGDYAVALEKLEKALQQNPNLPSAHNTIAVLYQRLGKLEDAESHFKEAVQRAPEYSEAHNNFGVFLCQQKRYDEAEQHFLTAIENPLYVSPAQALENAGMCANRIPDAERAENLLRKALQINPNLNKSLLQMAQIRYEQQDFLGAQGYIERYQSVAQWNPQSLMLAIKIANKLDDQDAVASYILLLKARFPDSDQAVQAKKGLY